VDIFVYKCEKGSEVKKKFDKQGRIKKKSLWHSNL